MSNQVYVRDESTGEKGWVGAGLLGLPEYEGRFVELDPECDCPKEPANIEASTEVSSATRPAGNAATKVWHDYVTSPAPEGLGLEADADATRDQLVAIADEYEAANSLADDQEEETE